jgi:diguanylate cyclase (GGDEF)-like protein
MGKQKRYIRAAMELKRITTEQKRMQERLMLEGERYRIASELSMDILFEYDIKEDEMLYTDKYREMFGRPARQPSYCRNRESRREYVYPDDWGIFLEYCNKLTAGCTIIEAQFRVKNSVNVFIWCQFMGRTICDENKNALKVIGKIVNIDSQKRQLEALEYKATRDPLTGVYNKEVTIKKIDKFISGNSKGLHALMFLDFDNYKKINDNYGHLAGDKVLAYMIKRIKGFLSEGESIGRIGGDEFIIFAGNANSAKEIRDKAEALLSVLRTGYAGDDLTIPVTASIGIALYPQDGLHYEQLVQHADKAMYKVKEHGKNGFMFYSASI